ncbi:MAG: hypothetical protein A2268_12885 [Candidatus Raymondbacteria bacterium RifOxyA12_full_50_37]|nr:MAG: hypothetical protein A2268_12885 [Candidatus Raymondbacteria bacterium RifOxyA12_full_50_37]OGJ86717.1 MAG: hypothetical protein A2248_17485 [Candidatus Raymondbacteria bacterium RIFOXYA2_FULL_49_16]OGJ92021.1 MAG: hypothetical protein A2350_00775 [Candidatus Raymondbacteria bacterium RifOxyB12_full_50_8]OGJ96450.1 MAG: hypothetical protein A2453_09235 [Candidatus Raymondbacteria bacterium RIFOXYC2_FULL_50_21]OGJ99547.1 MAG: hypothetical protein A2487_11340 [Candidatus Raymondbacteria b
MKYSLCAVITFFLFLSAAGTFAQERPFGLGVILGEPTGISAKLWVSPATAFDFGLGWSLGGDRINHYNGGYDGGSRVHFHMDYLWHWFGAIHSSERFPLYAGVGGRINTGAGYTNSVAARGVFGIAWLPRQAPIDIFLELVPSLQVVPSTGFGIDAGLGVRYFF